MMKPLSKQEIQTHLNIPIHNIHIFDTVDSTNTVAKRYDAPALIIAEHQSHGKGRMGRTFFSPANHGIYMSLVINPSDDTEAMQRLTLIAAVAVRQAIKNLYNLETEIKWLNDLHLNNAKLCGILAEGVFDMETQCYTSFIIGIGINTHLSLIPDDLVDVYTALNVDVNRNELIGTIINEFFARVDQPTQTIIDEYKRYSLVLGKTIRLKDASEIYTAIDISPQGHLVVLDQNKQKHHLHSGEVSVVVVHENA